MPVEDDPPQESADHALRAVLRRDLPDESFRRRPVRAWLMLPLLGFIAGSTAALLALPLPVYVALPLALMTGNAYASLLLLGHEIGHGAVVRSVRLQNLLLAPALALFCISPGFWRLWHNHSHHGHTNVPDGDPDSVGTLEAYRRKPAWARRYLLGLTPGSGHPLNPLYFLVAFTVHSQVVLWIKSRGAPGFAGLRRGRAGAASAVLAASWASLAVSAGARGAVLGVLVPMLAANAVVMAYIVTNHMMRPLSRAQDCLATTMSVRTHPVLDWMHFRFSHHVEHHLFPSMCSRYYPLVRLVLQRHAGARLVAPPHWLALVTFLRTPRVYEDATTLVDPGRGSRITTHAVETAFQTEVKYGRIRAGG